MKNNTFKKLIITVLFILLVMFSTNIYASNFNTALELESSNQDKENVVLILRLKDINFENIISTIEADLEYDKEIFADAKIENLNEWSIVYNKDNGKLIGFKVSDEQIKQEDLCKITLKLKEDIKDSTTQITMKNIKSADGDSLVASEDKIVNINIQESLITAEEEKEQITDKGMLKYLLIIVELVLVITLISSVTYLIQKYRLKKKYNSKSKK